MLFEVFCSASRFINVSTTVEEVRKAADPAPNGTYPGDLGIMICPSKASPHTTLKYLRYIMRTAGLP